MRRILRRAVRYGRTLGFHEPFFYKLVDALGDTTGGVFPEIRARKKHVQEVIRTEEAAFNKTLDRGIGIFDVYAQMVLRLANSKNEPVRQMNEPNEFSGAWAFELYDTYGFPLDLTELMARERGLIVDKAGFEKLMEEQKERARAAQKKEVITVSQHITGTASIVVPTEFVGYDQLEIVGIVQSPGFLMRTPNAPGSGSAAN